MWMGPLWSHKQLKAEEKGHQSGTGKKGKLERSEAKEELSQLLEGDHMESMGKLWTYRCKPIGANIHSQLRANKETVTRK